MSTAASVTESLNAGATPTLSQQTTRDLSHLLVPPPGVHEREKKDFVFLYLGEPESDNELEEEDIPKVHQDEIVNDVFLPDKPLVTVLRSLPSRRRTSSIVRTHLFAITCLCIITFLFIQPMLLRSIRDP